MSFQTFTNFASLGMKRYQKNNIYTSNAYQEKTQLINNLRQNNPAYYIELDNTGKNILFLPVSGIVK